jgi:hypothetical protein
MVEAMTQDLNVGVVCSPDQMWEAGRIRMQKRVTKQAITTLYSQTGTVDMVFQ